MISETPLTQFWPSDSQACSKFPKGKSSCFPQKDLLKLSSPFEAVEFGFEEESVYNIKEDFSDPETDNTSSYDPIEQLLSFSSPVSKADSQKRNTDSCCSSKIDAEEEVSIKSGEFGFEEPLAMEKEETLVEVDMGFYKNYKDISLENSVVDDLEFEENLKFSSRKEKDLSLLNPEKFYHMNKKGTLSNIPLSFFDFHCDTGEEDDQLQTQKKIQKRKKKSGQQKKKFLTKDIQTLAKKAIEKKVKFFKKMEGVTEHVDFLSSLVKKSQNFNIKAGKEMNGLLHNHMLCAREDYKHKMLVEQRRELVRQKRRKMLKVKEKRERVQKVIEKAFRE